MVTVPAELWEQMLLMTVQVHVAEATASWAAAASLQLPSAPQQR